MFTDLALLRQAGALARHAASRHRLIAENIANADTPQFRARDLPRFDETAARAAARGAEGATTLQGGVMRPEILRGVEGSPNGNTVNLEEQLVRGADAQAQHAAAMTIYRKSIELLRLSVSSRG